MSTSSEYPPARAPRERRYLSPRLLAAARPLLRHSPTRDAYVLRAVGNRFGPVLRPDRRRERRRTGALITE